MLSGLMFHHMKNPFSESETCVFVRGQPSADSENTPVSSFLISDVEFELGEEFGPIHPKIPERPEVEDIVLTTGRPPSRAGVTMFCFFIHRAEK